ncbi:MAG: GNAT family N-acetyltransferase [Defluviitaleaceae bacterium]|nr:GNAT family N-acetyltransferase [Defluviitaleaceae bacterium]
MNNEYNHLNIEYTDNINKITANMLGGGFFAGWPNPPSPAAHLQILRNSHKIWLAICENRVVGFINAISDGLLAAYIPLLEVLPDFQKQGIGGELVGSMLKSLSGLYMIDLLCDPEIQPFYESRGLRKSQGMMVRNHAAQNTAL